MWLDPVPLEQEIGKAYKGYYTHAQLTEAGAKRTSLRRRVVSSLFAMVNPVHSECEHLSLMYLHDREPGKVLDVGCGCGVRLARLRKLGWQVWGQEVDPKAVAFGRKAFGLEIHLGELREAQFREMSFDCVILNHVIEHVHDPIGLLNECRRVLKKGGMLTMTTPNAQSFGHEFFGASWRGLEPPRHLHLFSPKTLPVIAARAGLTVLRSWTTVANSKTFVRESLRLRNRGVAMRNGLFLDFYSVGYLYRSIFEHLKNNNSGEECVLQATV